MNASQRGFTLVEAAITVAVLSVALGAIVMAVAAFARYGAHQAGPHRQAALLLAQQTLRVAADAWKYGGLGQAPSGSDARGVTATLSAQPGSAGDPSSASGELTIVVAYPPDTGHDDPGRVTLVGALRPAAPLPGTTIAPAAPVDAPSGAP